MYIFIYIWGFCFFMNQKRGKTDVFGSGAKKFHRVSTENSRTGCQSTSKVKPRRLARFSLYSEKY